MAVILVRLVLLPVRLGLGASRLALRTGYRTGRVIGYRRMAVFGVGVGVGLLVAPTTGAKLRARLRAVAGGRLGRVPDAELAEQVRHELGHAPRTWHLPQPAVEASGGTIVLRGSVPNETARGDLERGAVGVRGVVSVDNRIEVAGAAALSGA